MDNKERLNLDVLGNPIVIGKRYGFARKGNMAESVHFGIAKEQITVHIDILVDLTRMFIWGDNGLECIDDPSVVMRRIPAYMLFPIDE